ncbi:hypothetical protein SCLCIDRAFT_1208575 [Scleroderma citrinum Foug A]|uniref:Uncharacterized protein n=1 Tax=Scleroderma citrinum Foug A TaxID=1036808 RepID=A0A0C3AW33_9AGAM|nr:hypothetical protein SCLCIDRAFT_1208575 [Scleroderma citrinum Foug A]
MASAEEVNLTPAHPPHARALEAFNHVLHEIKAAVVKSRHDWDKHEPMMWSRANRLSDHDLAGFKVEKDLVEIRTGVVSYGTLIFGKIRIPAVEDEFGAGYIHVRIHDPPDRGEEDVTFHSILHKEGKRDADGHPHLWRAIQTSDEPLEFFND